MNHLTAGTGAYSAFKSLLGQLYQMKYNDVSNIPYSDLICHTSVNNHTLNTLQLLLNSFHTYLDNKLSIYMKRFSHTEKVFLYVKNNKTILLFIKIDLLILKKILQYDVSIKCKLIQEIYGTIHYQQSSLSSTQATISFLPPIPYEHSTRIFTNLYIEFI